MRKAVYLAFALSLSVVRPAVSQVITQAFTLDYEGLALTNGAPLAGAYPGIKAATVTHYGRDGDGNAFESVAFSGAGDPSNQYGGLTNLAVGPSGVPAPPVVNTNTWGVVRIRSNYPNTFVRVHSVDLASLNDDDVDEFITGVYVVDALAPATVYASQTAFFVAGDTVSTNYSHVDFSGVPVNGPTNRAVAVYWDARQGRVGIDNVRFDIVGPAPAVLAQPDLYVAQSGVSLDEPLPGVLCNDLFIDHVGPLNAELLSSTFRGTLALGTNGSFTYLATNGPGMDGLRYRAHDTGTNTGDTVALVSIGAPGTLLHDDFERPPGAPVLFPWESVYGGWSVSNGVLTGTGPINTHAWAIADLDLTNCVVEAVARLSAPDAEWSIGVRLDPETGEMYQVAVVLLTGGDWVLRLVKLRDRGTSSAYENGWYGNEPHIDVPIPSPGTNSHTLRLTVADTRILVHWDGVLKIDTSDAYFGEAPYASGGVALGMFNFDTLQVAVFDQLIIRGLPAAPGLVLEMPEDTSTNLTLIATNGDPALTCQIVLPPANGLLSGFDTNNGVVTYQPALHFFGPDAFTYRVSDGILSSTGVVSITVTPVDDPPYPVDDSYQVNRDTPIQIPTPGVLFNDDVDGDGLTASLELEPQHGILVLETNGGFTYTPNPGYLGLDGFSYRPSDATTSAEPALVQLTVVVPDFLAPTLDSVVALDSTTVQVRFSEPVEEASAETTAHYSLDNGVTVLSAMLESDLQTVTLTTSTLPGGSLWLTVNGVADRAVPPGNLIAPNTQARFAFTPDPRIRSGLVALYGFMEGTGTNVSDLSESGVPLDLEILNTNGIQWVGGGLNGVRFGSAGSAIRSPGPATKVHDALMASGQVTLEAWVTPGTLSQSGPARIVSLSDGSGSTNVNLHLGQQFNDGSFRIRTSLDPSFQGWIVSDVLADTNSPTHLVLTYDGAERRFYVNGVQQGAGQPLSGSLVNWDSSYPFMLGNEATLDRSWLGTLHLVALYHRPLLPAEIQQNHSAGPSANRPPTAASLFIATAQGIPVDLTLRGTDPDGPVTFSVLTAPADGLLVGLDAGSGAVTYTPDPGFVGGDSFAYEVHDGSLSATGWVTVTVTNAPPVFDSVAAEVEVVELTLLSVTNSASDADWPVQALTYQLAEGPVNAVIDTNGVITWMPGEGDGPGTNTIRTVVSDGWVSVSNSFVVIVLETNAPPVFDSVAAEVEVVELTLLSVTNSASDADWPVQALTYQLAEGPVNAVIDTNGVITWTPGEEDGPGTNTIRTVVSDGWVSVSNSFVVTVIDAPELSAPVIQSIVINDASVTIEWTSEIGGAYRLEHTDSLETPAWTNAVPDVSGTGGVVAATNWIGETPQRYYRVVRVE